MRDQALAVSGLLNPELKGPSVRPYQPPGLWAEVSFRNADLEDSDFYTPDRGDKLYRRSMYTFWKRSLPPPNMQTFDAPNREICTARRSRTNTPLQALVLMNDPTFVEAARALAERILVEGVSFSDDAGFGDGAFPGVSFGDDVPVMDERLHIAHAFRRVTSRWPDDAELATLGDFLEQQRATFAADEDAARALLDVGDSMRDESLALDEHAAWTMLCSLLLNLDETVTKG